MRNQILIIHVDMGMVKNEALNPCFFNNRYFVSVFST